MTTSFPSSVWDAASVTRTNANDKRQPDGFDWQRLVDEINAISDQMDAIGLSIAGAFATSDPNVGKRLYANTNVLTLGGSAGAETYPNRWNKTTPSRPNGDDVRAPDGDDWLELIKRINNLEKRIQPLGIGAGGVIPTSDPSATGALWINTAVTRVVTVSATGGAIALSLWDGTSDTRPDADVYRAPDGADYQEAYKKLREISTRLVPLGIAADGTMPTSDPSVSKEWYTATNVVNSSA